MKITRLEMIHVRPRFSFLRIHTNEGLTGLGEAIVEGRSRTVEMAVKELEPLLIGRDPRDIERLWQTMYKGTFYRGGPILTSAISGIDQALWDILGKSLGVPVYTLLGGKVRDRIKLYTHVDGESLEELRAQAQRAVQRGFTLIKTVLSEPSHFLEPLSYMKRQIQRMEMIRDAIGPEIDMAVDFHGRVSPSMAIRLAKELEGCYPLFIEEPCLPQNVDTLATIARATSIPIATGERLYSRWDFRDVLEKQAAAIVQPDLAHCGGISEARRIASMAEVYYAGFAPHNPLGPINLAASLQVAAHASNFLAQEHVTLGEEYLCEPFVCNNGYIELSRKPGLGIELDMEKIEALRYSGEWETPSWQHEDDGSFAEW
ncbi:galactonate dehydratase [Paenibacillus ferrarius]|uniref:galactonate dehydratase n=1 Tax=Paenibacillus ferrarius TaxID=1469647 RepID=UPI003D288054